MLTRFHKILIALLAVQLALVVVVLTRSDDSGALKEHPILAGFDAAKVTRLQVFTGGEGKKPIDLVKRDAGWVVASAFDYPVDAAKVTDALGPIAKASAASPIATQASRHKQLHVADGDFERKLVITAAGKDVTLFIGGPAGSRRTAVRIGGRDDVFAVSGISAFSLGTEPRQWVDPSYVKVPREEIAKLVVQRDGSAVELARQAAPAAVGNGAGSGSAAGSAAPAPAPAADAWNVAVGGAPLALASGESLDTAAIDRLLGQAATIDLSAPADPKRDASKPSATITIERKASGGSTPAPTVIDVIATGESYWVHDRSQPRAVLVDKARIDDLVAVSRDKLIKKPAPATTQTAPPGAGSLPALPGAGSPTGAAVLPGGPG